LKEDNYFGTKEKAMLKQTATNELVMWAISTQRIKFQPEWQSIEILRLGLFIMAVGALLPNSLVIRWNKVILLSKTRYWMYIDVVDPLF
jgi:hypothetical protein